MTSWMADMDDMMESKVNVMAVRLGDDFLVLNLQEKQEILEEFR